MEHPAIGGLAARFGRSAVLAAVRSVLDDAREGVRHDLAACVPEPDAVMAETERRLAAGEPPRLRAVINATGVVLHTNLGRAPMATAAVEAATQAAGGYTNLEFDLASGGRGARTQAVEPLLCEITGAQAALVVNNAAAAVLLALSALAGVPVGDRGTEVIVSRGELVEIGGGFRIPDVVVQGGARLVEVGTTNKTRLGDYARAVTPATRVLLKVHQSNYRMVGFTGEASLTELAGLARERGLVLMHDLGGGALVDMRRLGLAYEPTVGESLAAGADIVAFSGDKLMGGPQAGLLVGRAEALEPLRRHPLLRALRADKMTLAALEATLRLYRDPAQALREIPALARLGQGAEVLQARAGRLKALVEQRVDRPLDAAVVLSEGFAGGGVMAARPLESRALSVACLDGVEALAARLRRAPQPVIARIAEGRLLLDVLAIADAEIEAVADALADALSPSPAP